MNASEAGDDAYCVWLQGSGACLDHLTSSSSVYWHKTDTHYDDDFLEDDFQVRLLSKAVQLCYVSLSSVHA